MTAESRALELDAADIADLVIVLRDAVASVSRSITAKRNELHMVSNRVRSAALHREVTELSARRARYEAMWGRVEKLAD